MFLKIIFEISASKKKPKHTKKLIFLKNTSTTTFPNAHSLLHDHAISP